MFFSKVLPHEGKCIIIIIIITEVQSTTSLSSGRTAHGRSVPASRGERISSWFRGIMDGNEDDTMGKEERARNDLYALE